MTKQLSLNVRWIPSHISEKLVKNSDFVVPAFVSKLDILANDWADEHAAKAAHSAEVPLNVSTPYLYHYHLIRRIQKRLVTILCTLPDRLKHNQRQKYPNRNYAQ